VDWQPNASLAIDSQSLSAHQLTLTSQWPDVLARCEWQSSSFCRQTAQQSVFSPFDRTVWIQWCCAVCCCFTVYTFFNTLKLGALCIQTTTTTSV